MRFFRNGNWIVPTALLLAMCAWVVLLVGLYRPGTGETVVVTSIAVTPAAPPPKTVEPVIVPEPIVLTAVGDIMLGRGVESVLAKTTIEAAFGETAKLFEGSDLVFGNLESVLTDSDKDTGKDIFFKADPKRVDVLRLFGFTHLSVANNHVDDYGKAGWEQSVEYVRNATIEPVGGYSNNGSVVSWPSTTSNTLTTSITSPTFAFLAYNDTTIRVDPTQLAADISDATTKADHVVVSFHWGVEYNHGHTERQIELAHAAVDAGADLVIGHHPHVLEGIEKYENGLILYSLGNFIFDQFGEDENESVIARVTFGEEGNTLELIPLRIRNWFPKPANETERQATLDRIASWSDASLTDTIKAGKLFW